MQTNLETGSRGELLAAGYLQRNGYTLLEKNWRFRHWEVDIIASKNNFLHVFEVKTRRSLAYGYPEESISYNKMQSLCNAAEEYQRLHPQWKYLQFNVLSIILRKGMEPEFFLIEDVYF